MGTSQREIASAYRRAVQYARPDARPDDRQAAARFQALTVAYELLGTRAGGRITEEVETRFGRLG